MVIQTYSREELYNLVWQTPMYKLAEQFDITDRGLSKLCKRMEIPTPDNSYWRRIELGQKVKKPSLPIETHSTQQVAELYTTDPARDFFKRVPEVVAAMDYEAQPENYIVVPKPIKRYSTLVSTTVKSLRHSSTDDYGRCHSSGENTIKVSCSKKLIPRIGPLLHTLSMELEKRGYQLVYKRIYNKFHSHFYNDKAMFNILGEDIGFSLSEGSKRSLYDPKIHKTTRWYQPKYGYIPTGKLTLKLEGCWYYPIKCNWSDKANKPLESQLNSLIISLTQLAIAKRERRLEEEREDAEREQLRKLQLEEEERIRHFNKAFEQWEYQERLKKFITAIENRDFVLKTENMTQQEWINWISTHQSHIRQHQ